jgi:hypothetical protein
MCIIAKFDCGKFKLYVALKFLFELLFDSCINYIMHKHVFVCICLFIIFLLSSHIMIQPNILAMILVLSLGNYNYRYLCNII